MAAKKLPDKKPRCKVLTDPISGDRAYHVELEKDTGQEGSSPAVDVWWNRSPKKIVGGRSIVRERLVMRQENNTTADVIIVTHGQAYDLIDALNRAIIAR